jgi:hypothetical protein
MYFLNRTLRLGKYHDLSVRLKKYTVFSLFRTENCGVFCIFHTVFSQRVKTRQNYHLVAVDIRYNDAV